MKTVRIFLVCLLAALYPLGATADFPQDPPNDPGWSGQYGLQSTIDHSKYPLAQDAIGSPGMRIDSAWADTKDWGDASIGRSDVLIAYIEGGINYNNDNAQELIPKVYLNRAEIEGSTHYKPSQYKDNGDPWYNALDFGKPDPDNPNIALPRKGGVPDENGNGYIDPEDLIVFYSDGVDDDGNGYVDDISGWDFYNDQNDPNSEDLTYVHDNNQMRNAAALTNDGTGIAGACPRCMLLPIRGGNEALDIPTQLAPAWLFAIDSGANVITSLTADLGYNSYMRGAVEYAWKHNVLVAESTNDFDSTDHQGGMYWPHDIGGNGVVSNAEGLGTLTGLLPGVSSIPLDAEGLLTYTFRMRSGETSWGPKALLSVAGTGSTSQSTGTLGGVLGLAYSYAEEAKDRGYIAHTLGASQILQILIHTADDITPSDYVPLLSKVGGLNDLLGGILNKTPLVDLPVIEPWPTANGWDPQTGYGRIDMKAYQNALKAGKTPPAVWFNRPQWYSLYDPTRTQSVPIYGHVAAASGKGASWTLAYGLGSQPTSWTTIASGTAAAPRTGKLGTLDLDDIPKSFDDRPMVISKRKTLESTERYTVTLRLRATGSDGTQAEERRTIAVHHDPSWPAHFPRRIKSAAGCSHTTYCYHTGGEGQPALVDLQGLGHLQIVFGDSDGVLHAIDPVTGKELPGFPVHTDPVQPTKTHAGVDPVYEPLSTNMAVGDLDHNGHLWIVAAADSSSKLYVWGEHGKRRPGWPKFVATGVQSDPIPRIPKKYYRPAHAGLFSSPVLVDWNGDGKLEILQAGWDGHIHIFKNDGSGELPGWPIKVTLSDGFTPKSGFVLIHDEKIDSTPVIADLDGDGKPDVVVRTQMSGTKGAGIQLFSGRGHLLAYDNSGQLVPGWPVNMDSLAFYYGSAQEFITEGSNSPVAADLDGDGKDEVISSPVFSLNVYSFNGDGSTYKTLSTSPNVIPDTAYPIPDLPISFTTSGAIGLFGGQLSYAQAGSTAVSVITGLLTTGLGQPIKNQERVWNLQTGLPDIPWFPAKFQGLDFLGAPIFADVTGDGKAEILDAGDSSVLHAYNALGQQASGFPKFTTGWALWSPSAGDLFSNGKTDIVMNTREGYTMVWKTPGLASGNQQWWHFHHDEWNTGNYGTDSRPPGILRDFKADAKTHSLAFKAPGDNWYDGQVDHYRIIAQNGTIKKLPADEPASQTQILAVPDAINSGTAQAVDAAGNLGRPKQFDLRATAGNNGGQGNNGNGNRQSGGNHLAGQAREAGCSLAASPQPFDPMLFLLLALACLAIGYRRSRRQRQ